jgi:hypothetical protein
MKILRVAAIRRLNFTGACEEKIMCVRVYSGSILIEERVFKDEAAAMHYADWAQDEGFKVRVIEND